MKSVKIFIAFTFLLAFALQVSAQNNSIPDDLDFNDLLRLGPKKIKNLTLGFSTLNELEGYQFFSNGKLNKLKIGVSTKENVEAILGTICKEACNYDSNWKIQFEYFEEKTFSTSYYSDGKGNKTDIKKFVPLSEYHGKIRSVKFIPQKTISFSKVTFSDKFYKFSSVAFGHDFDGNATHAAFDSYIDSYGLKYTVFDKISFSTLENKDKRQNGDLISIEYTIPKELEDKMFVEQK
jgi:hypothetical protein